MDDLKPSDAAKLWVGRVSVKPITGETFGDYRRRLRSTFNPLAHCTPVLAEWDAFLDEERTGSTSPPVRINHERYIIVSNAQRVDAFLVAHCWELLAVVESAYATYIDMHPDVSSDLQATKKEYRRLLEEHFQLKLLESIQPPEIEHQSARPTVADGDSIHTITEEFSGVRAGDRLFLDGVSAAITPMADDVVFMLDSFELALTTEGTELKGRHSCRIGDGEAVFRRV